MKMLARLASWIALIVCLAVLIAFAMYVPSNRDALLQPLKDMHVEVPDLTRFMLSIPAFVFPMISVCFGTAAIAAQKFMPTHAGAAVVHLLILTITFALFDVYREAMFQPLLQLIQSISAPQGGR